MNSKLSLKAQIRFRLRHGVWAFLFCSLFQTGYYSLAQEFDSGAITGMIQEFKRDERGPYQAIRWFCPDGTILPPKERCSEPGGVQHALPKDVVLELAREQQIYLGQILAGTDYTDFFDSHNQNSRLQQYQMEKYLQAVDNGWIIRRARYYRGAIQAEDEEAWGKGFLLWLVADDTKLTNQFFLLRQAVRDIPHRESDDRWQRIRGSALVIADSIPDFMNLRVKIHGQPDISDIAAVEAFYRQKRSQITPAVNQLFLNLLSDLKFAYRSIQIESLSKYIGVFGENPLLDTRLASLLNQCHLKAAEDSIGETCISGLAQLLLDLREQLTYLEKPEQRLAAMNLSLDIEQLMLTKVHLWHPQTPRALFLKHYVLTEAAAGCGYLELWEWHAIRNILDPDSYSSDIEIAVLRDWIETVRGSVEWGTAMIRTIYEPVINLFGKFEPLASGFVDDRVRSSLLLRQGETADKLVRILQKHSGIAHRIAGLSGTGGVRGLNPGYALGELVVINEDPQQISYSQDKIYMFSRVPADLKPVAGIITITEGNLVSHVQLLARNLGIPNAVLPDEDIRKLTYLNGVQVFYAVSSGGTVLLKPAAEMTGEEKALVIRKKRSEERLLVPLDRIDLNETGLIGLRSLRASDSGVFCGPKAANLAELKYQFPDNVVEGFVIPFGVFREHLEQEMPGLNVSYWSYLRQSYQQAESFRLAGVSEDSIETAILARFNILSEAIKKISLLPQFVTDLRAAFIEKLGKETGDLPVFIRSDTNMEDLKDFTGAGLNLTVFNVRDSLKIMQGIRDVWASPFSERSYRWRQKYLLNPENVYPSILIIPSVNVIKSGVMITTGIRSKNPNDLTVAFNRGAGGAVEGQQAESYLLKANGSILLLAPARELYYTELPPSGGIHKKQTFFDRPILSENELQMLRELSDMLRENTIGSETEPLDIELGFAQGGLWLFQVRPFVESKKAQSSIYLNNLDPKDESIGTFDLDSIFE